MDDYLQTQKLAIDAQLNLNKAQEANVKILDTLKAQLAGIRAEFDRLIVRSGALSSLTTGARFGKNVLGDLANMGKSTPATELANKQAKDRIVEDVLKTKPWSVRRAGYAGLMLLATLNRMTGMQTLAGLGGFDEYKYYKQMPGLVDFFNITHESPADKGQEAFGSRMQQIQGLSEANARRASFFDFASGKLGRGKMKTEDINLVASEMAQDHAAAFQKAWQTGDTSGAQRILADARERAKKEGVAAAEERAKAYNARLAEMNAGLLAQNRTVADLQSHGKNADQEIQQATDLAAAIRRVTDARDEDWRLESEANGDLDTVFEMQQRYVNLLKEQADTMELIGRMATQVSPHTALQGMDQQVSALTAELDVLQKQFDQVMKDLPEGPERRQVTDEIRSRQREAEAALASNQSPANRSLAQRFDERARGIRQAENQATAADYGIDATAKLLNQRKELTEDLARTEERLRHSQEGGVEQVRLMGQYLRDQSLLYENHLDLARRRANIEREIHQLAIDQNKEFMRSFIGSGPAEMLQKLAAFRMAFDNNGQRRPGLSQGAFFGLSPEMRANYGMLNPQYNPHMIELRNERNRVNGAKNDEPNLTLNDTLKKIEADLLSAKGLIPDAVAAAAECIRSGGRALGDELNGITDELKQVAAQVRGLHGAFNPSLAPAYSLPVNAQSGGLGGSKGFK